MKKIGILVLLLMIFCKVSSAQQPSDTKDELIFSAIKGSVSKADTIRIPTGGNNKPDAVKISGTQADFFRLISSDQEQFSPNGILIVVFQPSENFTGIARAILSVKNPDLEIPLTGLSTKGLEGENESPLAEVVDALGYDIDIGWTSLANHLRPELQGEELAPALFRKADQGEVQMIPVARYSPNFPLNFGYYTPSNSGPVRHQVGILAEAGQFPEHQTLFPGIALGKKIFDPGDSEFGFYAISPTHTAYSEDIWNILFYPDYATHAMRIYPVKDKKGAVKESTYLVSIEEAANGDYNDYVFLVKNVEPVFLQKEFISLFNGKDLSGWYTWLEEKGKNNDPDNIFTIQDETLRILGSELGYVMTDKSYGNFHFELEFKWGEEKWPPREDLKRDSGICYNIPENEPDQIWPQSVECQIQEGDTGDFWMLGYSTIQVDGVQNPPYQHSRMIKKGDAEKPSGQWNKVEVISFNGKAVHIVNGVVVNYGENSSLIGGKILLQSEYAEVFYRNINIREL